MNGPAERRDQIARFVEPPVGIVDDSALRITGDPVAVGEPPERGAPVDLIPVRLGRDPEETNVVVDREHGLASLANRIARPASGRCSDCRCFVEVAMMRRSICSGLRSSGLGCEIIAVSGSHC